jgi:hypothetical protein
VLVDGDDPPSVFAEAREVLDAPDVLFGNCEACTSQNLPVELVPDEEHVIAGFSTVCAVPVDQEVAP